MKNIFNRLKKSLGAIEENAGGENSTTAVAAETGSFMPSTPAMREAITGFIIQSLQPYIDEKGLAVSGLHFYIHCSSREQEEAARVALYTERPGLFKKDQLERKLLNHFIELDADWFFEAHVVRNQELPESCIRKENFGLTIIRSGEPVTVNKSARAVVEVLNGQTAKTSYTLDPRLQLKFYVGRTSNPRLGSGKMQQNDIVFLGIDEAGYDESIGAANNRVSRNHAYIVYDSKTNNWLLYPDKGGLPENSNKTKVHTTGDTTKWLNIYGISHCLCDGDQVELGGAAVFLFRIVQP